MKLIKIVKRFWILFLLGFLIGGFVVWNVTKPKVDPKIKTYTLVKQDLVDSLSLSGEIDATEKVSLRFQTSGLLTWVGAKEGDLVKKYQVLASLDKRQLQNQMNQVMNTYLTNRWSFEQSQADNKDWQTNGMTDLARDTIKRTLDKSQFSLNNAVLDVEAADLTLKFANLWTPIEGIVTNVDAPMAGQNITPATATFEVINPKTIYFSSLADQTEVTKFSVGQKGTLILDSFGDKQIEGTVTSIAFTPKADETGTVYEVKVAILLDDITESIRMGMTGDINFVFKEIKNVLAIPASYVKTDKNESFVNKMVGKTKQKTTVKIGETIDGNTEILSGLNEKDVIYSN